MPSRNVLNRTCSTPRAKKRVPGKHPQSQIFSLEAIQAASAAANEKKLARIVIKSVEHVEHKLIILF